jgi:tricarballylate dehydrogenase
MTSDTWRETDVLVIGGGAAALSAAITAREKGAAVTLLECAPRHFRGGNSRHTRNMRLAHETQHPPYTGAYPEEEMWVNYMKATGGTGDLELARMVVHGSASILEWMQAHGVHFQPALAGTLHLGRTNAWFLGGGKAMVNALFRSAERLGVDVRYEAEVVGLDIGEGRFRSAAVRMGGRTVTVPAKAVVVAAGGFQSNLTWLREAWGPAADNFLIRGAPFDTGTLLRLLLEHGAEPVGDPTQAHMVPIDARSPKFDGGIVTRLDCVTLGIVVNKNGERYYDEGEDFWPMRYAIWGRLVAQQPDQISYVLIDSKTLDRFMVATVEEFNQAVQPGTFDHTILDDCRTAGLAPPKTHWALRIDEPPFYGYPLRPGLTFTYYGVKIDRNATVIFKAGRPAANIFAAGEIMSGNILPKGYIGGFGLVIGNIFGRTAGSAAAALALGIAERKAA